MLSHLRSSGVFARLSHKLLSAPFLSSFVDPCRRISFCHLLSCYHSEMACRMTTDAFPTHLSLALLQPTFCTSFFSLFSVSETTGRDQIDWPWPDHWPDRPCLNNRALYMQALWSKIWLHMLCSVLWHKQLYCCFYFWLHYLGAYCRRNHVSKYGRGFLSRMSLPAREAGGGPGRPSGRSDRNT